MIKASNLKKSITDLREGTSFSIMDTDGQCLIFEGTDEGWRIHNPSGSIVMSFNQVLAAGNDVYLANQGDEGEQQIFAILDAGAWDFFDDDDDV